MSISKTDKGMLVLTLLALLSLASIGVQAQVLREDSALFEAPDGKLTVINAKAGTPARALKRQGFWVQVEVGGKNGWIMGINKSKPLSNSYFDTRNCYNNLGFRI